MFKNHPLSKKGIDEKIYLLVEGASLSMPDEGAVVLLADVENQLVKYTDVVWTTYTLHYKSGNTLLQIGRETKYSLQELEEAQNMIRRVVASLMINW